LMSENHFTFSLIQK